jgi:hypothetical protein
MAVIAVRDVFSAAPIAILCGNCPNGSVPKPSWPKRGQIEAKNWPNLGQKLVKNRPKIGQIEAKNWPNSGLKRVFPVLFFSSSS